MYLRGLGLGMIVTALVMTFGLKTDNKTMTDAEVRARAKELGMTDGSTTLKDASESLKPAEEVEVEESESTSEKKEPIKEEAKSEEEEKPVEEVKPEKEEKPAEEVKPEKEEKPTEEVKPEKEEKPAEEIKPAKEEKSVEEVKPNKDEKAKIAYTLKIEGGFSSDRVANILESAGVIDNASSFDKYLCSHGYDHRISTGTYSIKAGADYETIAKMITHGK